MLTLIASKTDQACAFLIIDDTLIDDDASLIWNHLNNQTSSYSNFLPLSRITWFCFVTLWTVANLLRQSFLWRYCVKYSHNTGRLKKRVISLLSKTSKGNKINSWMTTSVFAYSVQTSTKSGFQMLEFLYSTWRTRRYWTFKMVIKRNQIRIWWFSFRRQNWRNVSV